MYLETENNIQILWQSDINENKDKDTKSICQFLKTSVNVPSVTKSKARTFIFDRIQRKCS